MNELNFGTFGDNMNSMTSTISEPSCVNICNIVWRVVASVMTVLFGYATVSQIYEVIYNKTDISSYFWIPLYAVPVVLTFWTVIQPKVTDNKVWKYSCIVHAVFSLCMFAYTVNELVIIVHDPDIMLDEDFNFFAHEEGRELIGIVIIIVWMMVCKHCGYKECDYPCCCCCDPGVNEDSIPVTPSFSDGIDSSAV